MNGIRHENAVNGHVYYIAHKPVGVLSDNITDNYKRSSKRDRQGREKALENDNKSGNDQSSKEIRTIFELAASKGYPHVGLVGRLDCETSGVMLFTNDKQLTQAIRDPIVERDESGDEYQKGGKGTCKDDRMASHDDNDHTCPATAAAAAVDVAMKNKVYILDVLCRPDRRLSTWSNPDTPVATIEQEQKAFVAELMSPLSFSRRNIQYITEPPITINIEKIYQNQEYLQPGRADYLDLGWCLSLRITIREGKHHQIRRIAQRSRLKVLSLCRIEMADGLLNIQSIKNPGDMRWLTEEEVMTMKRRLHL
jgi:16S rRNA U516 pseudouridylate synthase RsuA-like enzyme